MRTLFSIVTKNPAAETAERKSVKVKKRIYHHPLPTPPPSRGRELYSIALQRKK